jgi:hypothetical protein
MRSVLVGEGFEAGAAVALLDEHFYFAFGFVELLFAEGGEAYAFFEELEGLLEGKVAVFELGDDGFELAEGVFEVGHVLFLLPGFPDWWLYRREKQILRYAQDDKSLFRIDGFRGRRWGGCDPQLIEDS